MPDLYAPTYDLFGYSIRYVVDQLKWDKFHIVAHSMGTFIAAPVSVATYSSLKHFILLNNGFLSMYPCILSGWNRFRFLILLGYKQYGHM